MSLPESHYNAPPPTAPYNTPPTLIAFTLVVLVLCFVGFCIVYICRYCFVSVVHTWAIHRTASGTIVRLSPNASPYRGLDPSMLQIFPTFLYASVKDLRKEKYSLECAICLVEFENESMLRLLTVCYHVFHQECIDLWLRSHKTCPVCRTELDSPTDETPKPQDNYDHVDNGRSSMEEANHEIRIDVKEREEGGDDGSGEKRGDRGHDHSVSMSVISLQHEEEQRFARSHSTGHSVVMIRGDEGNDDKYRLRLPEYVIRGRHNCRRSCASDKEMINVTLTTRPDAASAAASCSNCGFVQTVSGCSSSSQNNTEKT